MGIRAYLSAGFLLAFATIASAAALSTDSPAASNGAKAAHLDALFAELHAAPSREEGKLVEGEIVSEWLRSGDAEIDEIMVKAMIAMANGALDEAITSLNDIVKRKPDYVEGWNKRATVYYMLDEYDNSLADIQKTLQLEPRHFGALAGLGMIMVKIGDKQRALEAFERAYAVDPALDDGKAVIENLKAAIGQPL